MSAALPLVGVSLAAVVASALSGVALVGTAAVTGSVPWAIVGAIATAAASSVPLAAALRRLVGARPDLLSRSLRRPVVGWVVVVSATLLVSVSWAMPHPTRIPPAPTVATRWLARPDGTVLAVHVTRAHAATQAPLVVVHGGPGVADMSHDAAAFASLATDRDVYVYDRLGTGASSRLADPRRYTIARAVADLEALRGDIGAPQIAIHAHSWGARIAVAYAQEHPDHVAALVLSAPGDLPLTNAAPTPGDLTTRLDRGRLATLYLRLLRPRNLFTYGLTVADPVVAHRLAGDAEMDHRFAAIYRDSTPALFCDPGLAARVGTEGVGYYAHYVPQLHADPADDPVDLDRLAAVTAPVLVIKPACDYLPWTTAGYRRALPQARLVMLPDAGHVAYLEQPDPYVDLVHAFLTGRPLPLPIITGADPPPDYRGTR